jgi:murein DD-endopeptidase MepM/ murein hydrolase activator NlpD
LIFVKHEGIRGFHGLLFQLTLLLVALSLLLWQAAIPASADSISEKKEQARAVESQLGSLQSELNRLTAELSQTESRLYAVEVDIEQNQVELNAAEAELQRWKGILSERCVAMYKEGNFSAMEVFLECEDFDTFLNSYDYMKRIGDHDAEAILATRNLMSEIQQRRTALESQRAEYEAHLQSVESQKSSIQSKLNEQKAILAGLDSDIASMVSSRYGGGGSYVDVGPVNGLYFPVAGPHSYVNDWGAPRSGGRRHKGCDVMAANGTPLVAITSGTIVQRSGGNAGLYVFLYGDNGHTYYYMHMAGYAASGRVSAGQIIGYVGDTGNARGCPHLHFEFHPNGGAAINPYPLLCAIDQ